MEDNKKSEESKAFEERMTDYSGMRVYKDGKWISVADAVKQKESEEPKK